MNLKHVIVHKINKEQNTTTSCQEATKVLDAENQLVNILVDDILGTYKRGKSYGSFDPNVDSYPVQNWLKEYLKSQKKNKDSQEDKDECFVKITKRLLNRIADKMKDKVFATGGYFVFAEYTSSTQNYLLIAMVKDKKGLTVTPSLAISDITEIDLKNLHQAAQINIDSFVQGQEAYLSFLKAKNQTRDVLAYFTQALGCTDYIESKTSTNEVMRAVEAVCNEVKLHPDKTRETRDKVLQFLKDNIGNPITLDMVNTIIKACFLDEQIEYDDLFVNLANSDDYRISTEFTPNRQALRKYMKIDIKDKRWSLNFEKGVLGKADGNSDIVWDGEALTFRKIPEKYKEELDNIADGNF